MSATAHTGTLEVEGPNELKALVVVISGNVKFAETETEDGSISIGTEALRAIWVRRWAMSISGGEGLGLPGSSTALR